MKVPRATLAALNLVVDGVVSARLRLNSSFMLPVTSIMSIISAPEYSCCPALPLVIVWDRPWTLIRTQASLLA